jgi:hypothetical protein
VTPARRIFTLAQARRTLPFVARVVGDLVGRVAEFRRLEARRAELGAGRGPGGEEIERRLFDLEGEIERLTGELAPIGCELKDLDQGLLDFPARMGDREICLCWKAGEAGIDWWHPLETGFAGRRPVSELPDSTRGE